MTKKNWLRALALCIAFGAAGPGAQAAAAHGQAAELEDDTNRPVEDEPELAESLADIRTRAQTGDARHQLYLGALYEFGEKGLKRDFPEAAKWYAKAADQGLARAQVRLGFLYEEGKGVGADIGKAVALYTQSAEQGDAWGQAALGLSYMQGRGVEQKDEQAARWFRLAAEQGLAFGQRYLGTMLLVGRGVQKDMVAAAEWYRRAADQDDTAAMAA
ncbi:MAG TPA: tetratricopeptide repeat protein, partial [Ideonella sp.]|nr:tetratricopeptide repeat protein [Ideonella sp.]